MKLSENFTFAELTVTSTGLPNIPSDYDMDRLRRLAGTMEEIRYALGRYPITINSGYRSEQVNHAVGGSKSSAHLRGDAADFVCPKYGSPRQICLAIIDAEIDFDQLICEDNKWVHIGLSDKPRGQVMTMKSGKYMPGINL